MNTCETCRFWKLLFGGIELGECINIASVCQYEWTSNDFGCVKHRSIEDVIPSPERINQLITNTEPRACEWA